MAINKVSRSGSSLVTLAELQSGSAVFVQKAAKVSKAGPVITGGLVSQADIIKRGFQVQSLIGRAIVNPYGSIFAFFEHLGISDEAVLLLARQVALADQISITQTAPKFLLGKGISDTETILESLKLRITAFRVFEDAQFVSTATKFTLTRPLTDNQSLIDTARLSAGYQRAAADIQSIVDTRLSISIGKNNQDTVTQTDLIAKRVTALKQDQAVATEARALLPGKGIFDGVLVHNRDDPGPALFIIKALRDTATMLDLTGVFDGLTYQNIMYRFETITMDDSFSRIFAANRKFYDTQSIIEKIYLLRGFSYQDTTTAVDNKRLAITLTRSDTATVIEELQRTFLAQRVFQDTEIIAEVKSLTAGLGKNDVATMLERLARVVSKVNTDATTVIENIGKSPIKKLVDSVLSTEAIKKLIGKGITDAQNIVEAIILLLVTHRVIEDAVPTATRTFFTANKVLQDSNLIVESIAKNPGKFKNSIVNAADQRTTFAIGKQFGDSTAMQDLAAAFDGITYNYGLGKLDSVSILDASVISRVFVAIRKFQETQTITDVAVKVRGIGFAARTDTLTSSDKLIIGKIPFETILFGSGQDQRSRNEERVSFNFTLPITTKYRTLINDINFFTGYEEYLFNYAVTPGQSFAGSVIFASTSASAYVQVTSSGTGSGINGGFATLYGNYYISFNGTGNRSVTTIPLDLTTVSAASITFSVIAGNTTNGGEQPDLDENLVLEYSIDGTNFVTAATILATDTYGYSSWFQFSTSLPVAARTTSTLLRWRQTQQSLTTGDNYGITDIRLGSTSFGTFVRSYTDNNTVATTDYLIRGRFQNPADSINLLPAGYRVPYVSYQRWDQSTTTFGSPGVHVASAVHSSSSGIWWVSDGQSYAGAGAWTSVDGITWNTTSVINTATGYWLFGQDTSGKTLVSVSRPGTSNSGTFFYYSNDGGLTWASGTMPLYTPGYREFSQESLGKGVINTDVRPTFAPLYITGRATPTFIWPVNANSGGTTTAYYYLFSSGSGSYAYGSSWTVGGAFPNSTPAASASNPADPGSGGHVEVLGQAYGSGVAVVHLADYYLRYSKLYYLQDATAFPGNFTESTSISTSITGTYASNTFRGMDIRPTLAFGAGRFVWISPHGTVLTTTSPTVTASWQKYDIETTSLGIFSSIVYEPIKQTFIIARNGTDYGTGGYWFSTSGTQSSWTFFSNPTLRLDPTIGWYSSNAVMWPSSKVFFTSGSTSIAKVFTSFGGPFNGGSTNARAYRPRFTQGGLLYVGAYFENQLAYTNNIDTVKFGYGITAKQSVARSALGYNTIANDSDQVYTNPALTLTGIPDGGVTSTLVSSYTLTHSGNYIPWSEEFYFVYQSVSNLSMNAHAAPSPQGYYLTALKASVLASPATLTTVQISRTLTQAGLYVDPAQPVALYSFFARGDGSSAGKTIRAVAVQSYTEVPSTQRTFTLTNNWQRYYVAYDMTAQGNTTSYYTQFAIGLADSTANLVAGQAAYLWGFQVNTVPFNVSGDYSNLPPYIKTTSTQIAAGTTVINDYVTSITYQAGTQNGYWTIPYTSTTILTSYSTILPGNMLPYSQDFTWSGWALQNGWLSSNVAIAPDGTLTASRIIQKPGTNAMLFSQSIGGAGTNGTTSFGTSVTYTFSFFARGEGSSIGRQIGLGWYMNPPSQYNSSYTMMTLTGSWQRYSQVFVPTGYPGYNGLNLDLNPYSVGKGTLGQNEAVYIWGFQITTGSTLQAYMRTTSTSLLPATTTSTYTETSLDLAYYYYPTNKILNWPYEITNFNVGKGILLDPASMSDSFKAVVNTIIAPARAGSAEVLPVTDEFRKVWSINRIFSDPLSITDSIKLLTTPTRNFFETLFIGSGQDQRSRNEERISFNITKPFRGVYTPASSTYGSGGNLVPWSEDFTTSVWVATGVTAVADQTTAPDSTLTADKIVVDDGFCYIQQVDVPLQLGETYTHSVYLKGDGSSIGSICAIGNFDSGNRVGQTSITLTADWQRLSATFTTLSSGPNRNLFIQPEGIAGSNMAIGQAVFVWGYQVTTGSTLQAYVRTTSSAIQGPIISSAGGYNDHYVAIADRPYLIYGLRTIRETQNVDERFYKTIGITAKQGVNLTFSGTTVTANTSGERLFIGQQYTGAYRAGESLERIQLQANKNIYTDNRINLLPWSEDVSQGASGYLGGSRSNNVYTAPDGTLSGAQISGALSGSRVSTTVRVTPGVNYTWSFYAYKTGASTVANYRVANPDVNPPNPDGEILIDTVDYFSQLTLSSWTRITVPLGVVTSGAIRFDYLVGVTGNMGIWGWQLNEGSSATAYIKTSASPIATPNDSVRIGNPSTLRFGRDIYGSGYSQGESVQFAITSIKRDIQPADDFRQLTIVRLSKETVSITDKFVKDFFRPPVNEIVTVGTDPGFRRTQGAETTRFAITKYFGESVIPDDFLITFDGLTYNGYKTIRETVLAGLGIGPRVSGSDVERTIFDVAMPMRRGVAGAVTVKTINAAGNNAQSSVAINFTARDPDWVGTIDLINVLIIIPRAFTDFFTIGSDNGFRRTSGVETTKFTITKLAQTIETTSYSIAFGNVSMYAAPLNLSSYISVDSSAAFTLGTNDHTIEWYFNPNGITTQGRQFVYDNSSTVNGTSDNTYYLTYGTNEHTLKLGTGTSLVTLNLGALPDAGIFHHYAVVRSSNIITVYIDGGAVSSVAYSGSIGAQQGSLSWGSGLPLGSSGTNGYFTNFRFVNGTAVYTSNFTPSYQPLSSITNTQLLLLTASAGSYLTDSSPNNFTVNQSGVTWNYTPTPFVTSVATGRYFNTQPVQIGFGSSNSLGIRVSGSDNERTPFNITKRATQANYTPYVTSLTTRYFEAPVIDRGNLITRSEDFINGWSLNLASVSASVVTAPFGTVNGSKLLENSVTKGTHYTKQGSGTTYQSGSVVTFSIWAKAGERAGLELAVSNGVNSIVNATFNLSSGTVIATGHWEEFPYNGDWSSTTATMTDAGNGWYRCSMTTMKTNIAAGAGLGQVQPHVLIHNLTTSNYAGVVGNGIYIWGAQFEVAGNLGPYMPTIGAGISLIKNTANSGDFVLIGAGSTAATLPRVSGNQFENLSINFYKDRKDSAYFTSDTVKFSITRLLQENPAILDSIRVGAAYKRTVTATDSSDSVIFSDIVFRTLLFPKYLTDLSGDLDPFGNINTMVSNGSLRMTDYTDIDYIAEDYIGASRSFT